MQRKQIEVQIDVLLDVRPAVHRDVKLSTVDQWSDALEELLCLGVADGDDCFGERGGRPTAHFVHSEGQLLRVARQLLELG